MQRGTKRGQSAVISDRSRCFRDTHIQDVRRGKSAHEYPVMLGTVGRLGIRLVCHIACGCSSVQQGNAEVLSRGDRCARDYCYGMGSELVNLLAYLWYNLRDQTSEQIRSRRPRTWADPIRAARQRSRVRRRPASVIEEKKHYSPSSGTGGSLSVLLFAFCLPLFFGGSFGLFLCFFSCIS